MTIMMKHVNHNHNNSNDSKNDDDLKIYDCLEDITSSSSSSNNNNNSNNHYLTTTTEELLKSLSEASANKALELANDLMKSLKTKTAATTTTTTTTISTTNTNNHHLHKKSSSSSSIVYLLSDVPKCILEVERKQQQLQQQQSQQQQQKKKKKKKMYYGSSYSNNNNNSNGDYYYVDEEDEEEEEEDRLRSSLACCESILNSLSKVASGGSQASLELRALEERRRETDELADDIAAALRLRSLASVGADALGARRYADASRAIHAYKEVMGSSRAVRIAGEPTQRGYERTRTVLQRAILDKYRTAVTDSDLTGLSDLTPLLSLLDLANEGVGLYLRYSQGALASVMDQGLKEDQLEQDQQQLDLQEQQAGIKVSRAEEKRRQERRRRVVTVCTKLAKIYNAAVTHLRHHLPMVAYALGDADGDAALVQLVHLEVEKRAVDIIKDYTTTHQLHKQQMKAERVSHLIEQRYTTNSDNNNNDDDDDDLFGFFDTNNNDHMDQHTTNTMEQEQQRIQSIMQTDDCGFHEQFVSLSAVDVSLEEAALLLQHTESYERFIRHAVDEVNKARHLRAAQQQQQQQTTPSSEDDNNEQLQQQVETKFADILPVHTQLNESISEFGGYYAVLEQTLLLASLQRAVQHQTLHSHSHLAYAPLSSIQTTTSALQSALVEESFYAAQRSSLRALATGHAGTASAAANFGADIIGRVLYDVLLRRAHHTTTVLLKPGAGLLLLNNNNNNTSSSIHTAAKTTITNIMQYKQNTSKHNYSNNNNNNNTEEQKREVGLARACASMNDLQVAAEFSKQLEMKLLQEVDQTYSKKGNDPIKMCIKTLSQVQESFESASFRAVDQLVSTLLPRIRSIIQDAIGQEATTGFSLTGVSSSSSSSNTTDQNKKSNSMNMNYDLNDHDYEMTQISEGYINRLCSSLDDTIRIFRLYLAPKLSDHLLLGIIGASCKRMEVSIRRCQFTTLGALALDSDIRFFINFVKERVHDTKYTSSVELFKACNPLARLGQIALLMNVDDLEDVLDLISSCKHKGRWDLKLDDAKAFLTLRKDFEDSKVNELLHMPDDKPSS